MRNLISVAALLLPVSSYASPSIVWEGVVEGSLRRHASCADAADLVLLVSGEHRGEVSDCGCPARPLGGLARVETVAQRLEKHAQTPVLRVGAGHLFDDTIGVDGTLRPDVRARDAAMASVVGEWDVVNLGPSDVPWVDDHPLHSALSANILPTDDRPHRRIHEVVVGEHTVALIGLAGPGLAFLPPQHHQQISVVDGLVRALESTEADVVVVIGVELGEALLQVAGTPRVDLLITAERNHERWAPEVLGETVWVRTVDQGQVLTELRLSFDDGLSAVHVSQIDLDEHIPDDRRTRQLLDQVTVAPWP